MLPDDFLDRMKVFLGEEFAPFLTSFKDASSLGLRVNTLKLCVGEFLKISPYSLHTIPWTGEGFTLPLDSRPGTHPYHAAGLYYLQDPSAMAVTELLDPQPGDRILDLAAAPGGKTTHIAAKMNQQGLLVANDINTSRSRDLYHNLERWGARNTVVLNETSQRLATHFGPFFDKVLLDAPCSGEGMFRKDPKAIYEWSPKMVVSCANRQDLILAEAAKLVRSGGRLVYATCTFAPEENEGTVFRFLQVHPEFAIERIEVKDGFSSGRPEWISQNSSSGSNVNILDLRQTVRLWPHKAPGEGHFIAVLRKNATPPLLHTFPKPFQISSLIGNLRFDYETFAAETLQGNLPLQRLSLHGSHLYQIPNAAPDLHGLRVIHWGWWLGTFKTRRFEPSQALVMALTPTDLCQVYDFQIDDSALMSYLRGQVLVEPGPDGWIMISVDGYPLGWAKRVKNRLKPHFPRWLRMVGSR